MKAIALTAALALSATGAAAGSMAPVAADPVETVAAPETSGTSYGMAWLVPLVAIAAIVASQD